MELRTFAQLDIRRKPEVQYVPNVEEVCTVVDPDPILSTGSGSEKNALRSESGQLRIRNKFEIKNYSAKLIKVTKRRI